MKAWAVCIGNRLTEHHTRASRRAIDSVQGTGNYAEVTILVRFCQVATRYGVPETEELSLAAMGLHRHNQIA